MPRAPRGPPKARRARSPRVRAEPGLRGWETERRRPLSGSQRHSLRDSDRLKRPAARRRGQATSGRITNNNPSEASRTPIPTFSYVKSCTKKVTICFCYFFFESVAGLADAELWGPSPGM